MKKILFILAAMLLSSIGLHAGNIITYTASEKLSDPTWGALDEGKTTFGPAITKHEFSNGIGVITCAGEITKIGERAFYSDKMTSISIPNTVKTIEYEAFYACDVLTSIEIPNLVTSIGYDAFYDCHGLKTVYCYALDPPTVGSNAFANVPQDISVYTFNTDVYKITWEVRLPTSCFKPISTEVGGIKYEFFDGNKARVVAKDGGYTGAITIPEKISYMGYTFAVTEIGQSAFQGAGLTSVTIPASVKGIGDWAFKNCTNLSKLEFAERLDAINIGTYAFENMAVEEVIIPDWLTVVPEGLFYANSKLEGIYLHERVKEFKYRPFGKCNNLKYIISMPTTPPEQDRDAFEEFNGTTYVYVTSVDAKTKYENDPKWNLHNFVFFLDSITYKKISNTDVEVASAYPIGGRIFIPAVVTLKDTLYNVAGIGSGAIKDQTELQHLILPPTMKYIGDNALEGCTSLKNVKLPIELQEIGASAFYGCSALDSIYIPDAVQTIGKSAFMDCKNLTSISLPTGLKNIPDECFHKCPLGTEIIVPEGVETIGKYAFEGTEEARLKAKSIALPSTLKEINFAAFYLHHGLKTITCRALIPPTLTEQAFASKEFQAQQITVYVPNRDVVTAYKRSNWGDSIRYNFKFSDLMAEENKAYLYEVAGDNKEAKAIADAYCDSIDRATTTQQVQYYINTALTKIDKYTLNDYKIKLANYLDSVAGENLDAQRIAEEYRKKILLAIFRQEAEKIFAEGLAKINAVFELIDFKKACCDNLRNSAQNLGKEIKEIAEEYCILINQATTKEEANRIYLDGSQEISMYMQLSRYWEEPSNPGECRTTYGYPK